VAKGGGFWGESSIVMEWISFLGSSQFCSSL